MLSVQTHRGELAWLGEHWVGMIRPAGAAAPSAIVSLFHTDFSLAGEGHAAVVRIGGAQDGWHALCADSPELARFVAETFFARSDYFDPLLPLEPARFARGGDTRHEPSWTLQTPRHRVVVRWSGLEPPVVATGSFRAGTLHLTTLFFCRGTAVELDGHPVPGEPFPRDIWKPSIGGQRSSCVFALGETLLRTSDG